MNPPVREGTGSNAVVLVAIRSVAAVKIWDIAAFPWDEKYLIQNVTKGCGAAEQGGTNAREPEVVAAE